MGQYHVETAVVVEIGGDDCGRIFLCAGIWKVYRRVEGSIAVAGEQRETGYNIVQRNDEVESAIAVKISRR